MLGLIRRTPTLNPSPLSDLDGLFDDLFSSFSVTNTGLGLPSVDIYREDDQNMVVEMQAPGFSRDDIAINIDNRVLEIRGERTEKEEHTGKKRSYLVRESSHRFARRIVLPDGADSEKITAELDKGILKVIVPVERHEAKRVEIAEPKGGGPAKLTAATGTADAIPQK